MLGTSRTLPDCQNDGKILSCVASAWRPLHGPTFRAFWLAGVASNIGSLAQDASAAWLMTSLTGSPLLVSMMQAAASLPIFLFALPAGALADVLDRRKLMLFAQGWMLLSALALAVSTLAGWISPWLLLSLTFATAAGAALYTPSAQATLNDLLSQDDVPRGIVLGGVSLNIARAAGPLAGGLLIASVGPWAAFTLNVVSFAGILLFLHGWKYSPRPRSLPSERFFGAMTAALRFARHSPALQTALVRGSIFAICASAVWSLLPLLARRELGLDAVGYGLLLGCVGCGALICAALIPWARVRFGSDAIVAAMSLFLAAVTVALAHLRIVPLLALLLVFGGVAWLAIFSTLAVAAGRSAPFWVKGRGLAVYYLTFQGYSFAGSLLWGTVATWWGMDVALTVAAAGLALGSLARFPFPLAKGEGLNLAPSDTVPLPLNGEEPEPDRGPVMVTIEYRVAPEHRAEFGGAMAEVRLLRHRDGAFTWGLFEDTTVPGRYLEFFLVESWLEHLRQHERMTVSDRELEARACRFHQDETPPRVSHYLAERAACSRRRR